MPHCSLSEFLSRKATWGSSLKFVVIKRTDISHGRQRLNQAKRGKKRESHVTGPCTWNLQHPATPTEKVMQLTHAHVLEKQNTTTDGEQNTSDIFKELWLYQRCFKRQLWQKCFPFIWIMLLQTHRTAVGTLQWLFQGSYTFPFYRFFLRTVELKAC